MDCVKFTQSIPIAWKEMNPKKNPKFSKKQKAKRHTGRKTENRERSTKHKTGGCRWGKPSNSSRRVAFLSTFKGYGLWAYGALRPPAL
jgi:hypothetical protein